MNDERKKKSLKVFKSKLFLLQKVFLLKIKVYIHAAKKKKEKKEKMPYQIITLGSGMVSGSKNHQY